MKFTTGTRATDPGRTYDREPVPVGDTIRVIAGELGITLPADPDLYARTAPAWNCVTDPIDGPHYHDGKGGCHWCGKPVLYGCVVTRRGGASEWKSGTPAELGEWLNRQDFTEAIVQPIPSATLDMLRPVTQPAVQGECWLHPGGCPATCPRYTAPAVQGELSRDSYPPYRRRT